eukprot:264825-Prymnesium_polylepis.1
MAAGAVLPQRLADRPPLQPTISSHTQAIKRAPRRRASSNQVISSRHQTIKRTPRHRASANQAISHHPQAIKRAPRRRSRAAARAV